MHRTSELSDVDEDARARRLVDGLTILAILIGSALRVAHFSRRGSFWGDEAALAYNLLARSYGELTRPLDLWQAAPAGYLIFEKLLGTHLGMEEHILRLPSLLAGIATLVLCAWSFQSLFGSTVAVIATLFLAFSPELIRYSCEFKPYALDAAISIGLFALFANPIRRDRWRTLWPLAVAGAIAPWFSLPSVFVLAGCGGSLGLRAAIEGNRRLSILLALSATLWAASFAVEYLLCLRAASTEPELLNYWSAAFAPFPPRSLADLRWYGGKAVYLLEPAFGRGTRHLTLIVFLTGCGLLGKRHRLVVGFVLAMLVAVLAASAARKYPFTGRLLLFLLPILILPIAVCFQELCCRVGWRRLMVGLTLLGLLLWQPIQLAATRIANDSRAGDTKRANIALYQAMIAGYRPGDQFVISPEANWGFRNYSLRYGFQPSGTIFLSKSVDLHDEWVKQLAGHGHSRRWLVFALSQTDSPESETSLLTKDLPATVRLVFDRSDQILGLALRCYEPLP